MKPILLWSDMLILLLLAVIAASLCLARRNETLRAPLRQVLAHQMGA